jgi:diguanylate cyclase (GGDEF)-like protein
MGFFRMRAKIAVVLALLVSIPAGFLGWVALQEQEKLINKTVEEMNSGLTALLASHIYRLLESTRRQVELLASVPTVQNLQSEGVARVLMEALKKNEILDGILLIDRAKHVVGQAERHRGGAPRPFFGKRFFSEALLDRYGREGTAGSIDRERSSTVMSAVVYAEDDSIQGVLQAAISGQYVRQSLDGILKQVRQAYEDLDVYVVTEDEQIIMASRDAEFGRSTRFPAEEVRQRSGFNPSVSLRRFQPYQTPNWFIWVIPRPSAAGSAKRVQRYVEEVIFISIGVAILIGLLFATSLTRPVHELVRAAMAISRGELGRPVSVTASDEIGELAESFELMRKNLVRMQGSLKDRIEELQTLYGVSKAVSATLDLSELLHVILERVMAVMKAERGSVMLYEEETDELRVEVSRGIDHEHASKARVKLGDRVSGYVLQTGRPLLIQDSTQSPNLARLKEGQVTAGTMLSVPLIIKDKRLGVLNVSKSTPFTFDEKDQELFIALANQAAIAIENARLYTLAITDELTKLYIRRFFYHRMREEMRRSLRYEKPLSVMMLDVDHFKIFNDTYGHQAGDEVLQFVARTMRECARSEDIVARLGGEEFAILCPEQSEDEAYHPAERIRRKLQDTNLRLLSGVEVNVTTSIGISQFPRDAEDRDTLLDAADQALYHAKHAGRNQVCFFHQVEPGEAEAKKALEEGKLNAE